MITEHGEHQIRQPKRNDHPVNRIDPVKPVNKIEADLETGKEKVKVLEKRKNQDVQNDKYCQHLLPIAPLIGPEQPPSSEIIANNQHTDQCEENRDKREVIRHTCHHQPKPLIRIPPFTPGRSAPLPLLGRGRGRGYSPWILGCGRGRGLSPGILERGRGRGYSPWILGGGRGRGLPPWAEVICHHDQRQKKKIGYTCKNQVLSDYVIKWLSVKC